MTKFAVLKVDGTLSFEEVDAEKEYDFLSGTVGGYIQAVPLSYDETIGDLTLWCNEEGKLDGLPFNQAATMLWELFYGKTDYMVGDVVLSGGTDEEGNTISISEERSVQLAQLFSMV